MVKKERPRLIAFREVRQDPWYAQQAGPLKNGSDLHTTKLLFLKNGGFSEKVFI
jgi:hypothetical protein